MNIPNSLLSGGYNVAAPLNHGQVYTIKNLGSGLTLDAAGSKFNSAVVQYSHHGGNNQRWRADLNSDGTYSFKPMHMNAYLESLRMKFELHTMNDLHDGKRFYVLAQNGRFEVVPRNAVKDGNIHAMVVANNNNGLQVTEAWSNRNSLHCFWTFS